LQDSSHGGALGKDERMMPLDQQYQFLGRLQFPVTTDTEAWQEKVSFIDLYVFMSLLPVCIYIMI
jgi:callose synthase